MRNEMSTGIFLCICLLFLSEETAHAYLDPGTGSAILQGVLAALAGIAVALKLYWHRLLRLLGLKKNKMSSTEAESEGSKSQSSDTE